MELTATVPQEKAFYVNGGPVIYSAGELAEALENGMISDESFAYHVENGKNDFATWIQDVIRDEALAKSLKKIRTKKSAIKKLKEKTGN